MTDSDWKARLDNATSTEIPEIYFNGFMTSITPADVVFVLERDGRPVAKLNASYTVAKTLGISLLGVVSNFEQTVKRSILTTHDIEQALKDASSSSVKQENEGG